VTYDLTGAQESKRNNEAKAKEFYQKVVKQEQELRELQKESALTEKQSAELQRQKAELEAKMKDLSTKLETTNRTLTSLKSQVTTKKQGIERDQSEMERFQEEVVKLDRQIGELMKHRWRFIRLGARQRNGDAAGPRWMTCFAELVAVEEWGFPFTKTGFRSSYLLVP
jgi:chromosome segregation ATPase